jgi:hypothetical protein
VDDYVFLVFGGIVRKETSIFLIRSLYWILAIPSSGSGFGLGHAAIEAALCCGLFKLRNCLGCS